MPQELIGLYNPPLCLPLSSESAFTLAVTLEFITFSFLLGTKDTPSRQHSPRRRRSQQHAWRREVSLSGPSVCHTNRKPLFRLPPASPPAGAAGEHHLAALMMCSFKTQSQQRPAPLYPSSSSHLHKTVKQDIKDRQYLRNSAGTGVNISLISGIWAHKRKSTAYPIRDFALEFPEWLNLSDGCGRGAALRYGRLFSAPGTPRL